MLTIKLIQHTNYTGAREQKLYAAIQIMERVLNSKPFHEAVINYTTNGKLTFSFKKTLFRDFDHYTNEEVYASILQAKEEEGNVADGSMDLYLELAPGGGGNVLGYGYPNDPIIYTYADWFDNQTPATIANHLTHEWCHKIGFEHAFYGWQDKNRERSVPYGIGNLVEQLA